MTIGAVITSKVFLTQTNWKMGIRNGIFGHESALNSKYLFLVKIYFIAFMK